MAVQRPGKRPAPKVKDVDDDPQRDRARTQKPGLNQREQAAFKELRQGKPAARKPGRISDSDDQEESDHVSEKEHTDGIPPRSREKLKKRDLESTRKKAKTKKGGSAQDESSPKQNQEEGEEEPEVFNLSRLAAEQRVDMARTRGFQQTPAVSDYFLAKQEVSTGQSFAEKLNMVRPPAVAKDPEQGIEPEEFLSAFESMKDVYVKTYGRASPKTAQLLESPDLEDMIQMLQELLATDVLRLSAEARISNRIYQQIQEEPGPILLGLNDQRLNEVWRLFDDGWDIWLPDIESDLDDVEASGVELFWEGEAEDASGNEFEIVQMLSFTANCVKLSTRFGEDRDEITFDGGTFYRLTKR